MTSANSRCLQMCKPREMPRSSLHLMECLGKGNYGATFRAQFTDSSGFGRTVSYLVAVKSCHVEAGAAGKQELLGEAALTELDAQNYYASYEAAIHAIGKASNGRGIKNGPGISIKLSALFSRYEVLQRERVFAELLPRVWTLIEKAARANINLTIDAEEVDRLELSLDLLNLLSQVVLALPLTHLIASFILNLLGENEFVEVVGDRLIGELKTLKRINLFKRRLRVRQASR